MSARTALLTVLAMLTFARNSLMCRMSVNLTAIDAASFATVRQRSGAMVLWLLGGTYTWALLASSLALLGGIALVIRRPRTAPAP